MWEKLLSQEMDVHTDDGTNRWTDTEDKPNIMLPLAAYKNRGTYTLKICFKLIDRGGCPRLQNWVLTKQKKFRLV